MRASRHGKMKKSIVTILALIVIIALGSLVISGCGDDSKSTDKSQNNKLVGKYCPENDCSLFYLEINEDGTFYKRNRVQSDDKGKYEVKGNELRLIQGSGSKTWEISGTDLIRLNVNMNGDSERWEKQ